MIHNLQPLYVIVVYLDLHVYKNKVSQNNKNSQLKRFLYPPLVFFTYKGNFLWGTKHFFPELPLILAHAAIVTNGHFLIKKLPDIIKMYPYLVCLHAHISQKA
jgi:hypothetical protein